VVHVAALVLEGEIVDALPTSPVGKIMKRELRERLVAKMAREAGV
jgi:acyl-CoA synthetase (AMP-forming)/AMP-acid ligase II